MQKLKYNYFFSSKLHDFLSESNLEIQNSQNFFPLYNSLYKNVKINDKLTFSQRYYLINAQSSECNTNTLYNASTRIYQGIIFDTTTKKAFKQSFFIKLSNIIDPLTLVKGKYGNIIDNKMIRNKTESDKLTHKLYFQFNSAYVESLAYHLVSNLTEKNICPHFPLIYGVYNGCAKNFYTEFTEEYKQVYNLSTYQEGEKKGYFNIVDPNDNFNCNFDLDIDTISLENENSFTLNNKLINKDLLYLQIKNCPVQIIAMETYEHTLQDIMNSDFEDINTLFLRLNMCENNYVNKFCYKLLYQYKSKKMEKKYFALLFQVVMALCCCQSKYDMCHNDLHIQNIMVKLTHEEYLFYKFENRYFKVPTYGYIVKIIDFGRATFTLNDTFYIGDVFKYSSEAGEQYSYPYSHWKSKKNIPPNKHFDLCRLACSIIEDYYQVKPDTLHPLKEISKGHYETVSPLYNMLCEWSTDKYHQSVMRFDNFDLYKIIARRASHSLPASQTRNKYFSNFKIKKNDIPPKAWVYCIV